MRLDELFSPATPVKDRLRQMAIDFLTPLIAHQVPFVTVQQMVDELRHGRTGILVDRAMVMNLQEPGDIDRKMDDDGAEKAVDKIKDMARQKARKSIKDE